MNRFYCFTNLLFFSKNGRFYCLNLDDVVRPNVWARNCLSITNTVFECKSVQKCTCKGFSNPKKVFNLLLPKSVTIISMLVLWFGLFTIVRKDLYSPPSLIAEELCNQITKTYEDLVDFGIVTHYSSVLHHLHKYNTHRGVKGFKAHNWPKVLWTEV